MGVRIKPLEWNENGIAKTLIGFYWIGRAGGDWRVFFQININRESIIATGSASGFEQALIDARAAAEIDWQGRGRTALNELAHPQDLGFEVTEKMVERLRASIISASGSWHPSLDQCCDLLAALKEA